MSEKAAIRRFRGEMAKRWAEFRGLRALFDQAPKRALRCFDRALAVDPGYAAAHHGRGMALAALGRHDDACEAYRAALRLNPAFGEAYRGLGSALNALRRHEDALVAVAECITLEPKAYLAYYERGVALSGLGRQTEAVEAFEEALRHHPAHADSRHRLGLLHIRLGNLKAARREARLLRMRDHDRAVELFKLLRDS
jgi:tetratricopeptide (TPR) repeat protein